MDRPLKWTLWMLIGVMLISISSCRAPQAPVVKGISKFRVNRKNPDRKVQFHIGLEVFNPNKYKVKLKSYDLKVFLNDVLIGEARENEKQVMKKQTANTIEFAMRTNLKKVLGGIGGIAGGLLKGKKGIDLRIVGNVRAKALGIGKRIPVDYVKTLDWKDLQL